MDQHEQIAIYHTVLYWIVRIVNHLIIIYLFTYVLSQIKYASFSGTAGKTLVGTDSGDIIAITRSYRLSL